MERRQHKAFSAVMLTLILVGMLAFAFNVQPAKSILPSSPPVQWTQTYGGTDYDVVNSAIQTSDGGYALAGYTKSIGAGFEDFWLVKTNTAGIKLWEKAYGGTGGEYANSVIQTNDGGYALGGYGWNYWGYGYANLVKTDPSGTISWTQVYGGTGYFGFVAFSVIQTSDLGYALAGQIMVSLSPINYDMMLVKTNPSGSMVWSRTYGGTGQECAFSVIQTSDGGYAVAGYTTSYGAGSGDAWLVKTNSNGNIVWSKASGGPGAEIWYSVIQTSDGGYAVAGKTESIGPPNTLANFWLMKTDSNGNMLWNKAYDNMWSTDIASSLVQSSGGGYAVAGRTLWGDTWLIKTDTYGNLLWSATYGTAAGYQIASSVIWTKDKGYAVAGSTSSYGAGAYDGWLIKLRPILSATVVYLPPILDLGLQNPDVTAIISPTPTGSWSAADINVLSIRLGGTVQYIGTMPPPPPPALKVRFDRVDVNSFVNSLPVSIPPLGTSVSLTIIGTLNDVYGTVFEATGSIWAKP